MTLGLGENDLGHIRLEGATAPTKRRLRRADRQGDRHRNWPRLGTIGRCRSFGCGPLSPLVRSRWSSTPTALNALAEPQGPRTTGRTADSDAASGEFGRLASAAGIPGLAQVGQAAQFAGAPPMRRRAQGPPLADHRRRSQRTQRDRQPRHGHRRHGRCPHRRDRGIRRVKASRRTPQRTSAATCMGWRETWRPKSLGQVSLIASDLLKFLPCAFQTLNKEKQPRTA